MKNNKLSIGQMAKVNSTTAATLRFYNRLGVLSPSSKNSENQYWSYDVKQSLIFYFIQEHKNLGFHLRDIQRLTKEKNLAYMVDSYDHKIAEIEEMIKILSDRKNDMIQSIEQMKFHLNRPTMGRFALEYIQQKRNYSTRAARNYFVEDIGSVVYDFSCLIKELANQGILIKYPDMPFVTMQKKNFLEKKYGAHRFGIRIDGNHAEIDAALEGNITDTKAGEICACVYFDDFDKVQEYLDGLWAYCHDNGYVIHGDVTCQMLDILDEENPMEPAEFMRLSVPIIPYMKSV